MRQRLDARPGLQLLEQPVATFLNPGRWVSLRFSQDGEPVGNELLDIIGRQRQDLKVGKLLQMGLAVIERPRRDNGLRLAPVQADLATRLLT